MPSGVSVKGACGATVLITELMTFADWEQGGGAVPDPELGQTPNWEPGLMPGLCPPASWSCPDPCSDAAQEHRAGDGSFGGFCSHLPWHWGLQGHIQLSYFS